MPARWDPDAPENEPVVLGAVLSGTFVLVAYPGIGIIRDIVGQRGLAMSPLFIAPGLWLLLIPVIHFESQLQQHPSWERIQPFWSTAVATLGLVVPLVVALVWPVPVLTKLPRGIPALTSIVAPRLVGAAIVALGSRRRRRRDGHE